MTRAQPKEPATFHVILEIDSDTPGRRIQISHSSRAASAMAAQRKIKAAYPKRKPEVLGFWERDDRVAEFEARRSIRLNSAFRRGRT